MTKWKVPQILHGRNTLQKYVENRELQKNTQKVLKPKSVENQDFMFGYS